MKQLSFIILACLIGTTARTQTNGTGIATKNQQHSITGAWQSVDKKEFLILSDGHFASIMKDSTGKWNETHAGSYTIDDAKTLTMKANVSSFAYRIGYLHTVEFEIAGDTLTIHFYKKLIDPKAGDLTARVPKGVKAVYNRAER